MRDDGVYLEHIVECIRRIEENTADGKEAFAASHTLQDAVLRNLQTMAEATQRLSQRARDLRPDIVISTPWLIWACCGGREGAAERTTRWRPLNDDPPSWCGEVGGKGIHRQSIDGTWESID